ncbi:MAG: hypothetical protein LW595_06050 [Rickettsiales bacterium]|nr:hypothetical protein [Rickettsiales bacterium]
MFGFSLAELILILLVSLIFIKPADLPEIAYFIGKIFFKIKKTINNLKNQYYKIEQEMGLEEIRQELERGMADAKINLEDKEEDGVVIVDIYGNEHIVSKENLPKSMNSDNGELNDEQMQKTGQEIMQEIERLNLENKQKNNQS